MYIKSCALFVSLVKSQENLGVYTNEYKCNLVTDSMDNNCTICYENLYSEDQKVSLRCKHNFHSSCIKTWLKTNSVCPLCRVYTLMDDDYPPL